MFAELCFQFAVQHTSGFPWVSLSSQVYQHPVVPSPVISCTGPSSGFVIQVNCLCSCCFSGLLYLLLLKTYSYKTVCLDPQYPGSSSINFNWPCKVSRFQSLHLSLLFQPLASGLVVHPQLASAGWVPQAPSSVVNIASCMCFSSCILIPGIRSRGSSLFWFVLGFSPPT